MLKESNFKGMAIILTFVWGVFLLSMMGFSIQACQKVVVVTNPDEAVNAGAEVELGSMKINKAEKEISDVEKK